MLLPMGIKAITRSRAIIGTINVKTVLQYYVAVATGSPLSLTVVVRWLSIRCNETIITANFGLYWDSVYLLRVYKK